MQNSINSTFNKKAIAICGSSGKGAEEIKTLGVSELYFSCTADKLFSEIVKNCREDLYNAAVNVTEKYRR